MRLQAAATQPRAMPTDRLSLRLSQLPHDVLAELAARLCSDSPALQAAADECMATHTPLPHDMVAGVLFSPDLVPHILGTLEAEDAAAAAVCSQWLAGWKATNEPRRRLKHVRLDFPEKLLTDEMQMAITPDGRLVARTHTRLLIMQETVGSMRLLQTVPGMYQVNTLFASTDDSIFYASWRHPSERPELRRARYGAAYGTNEAAYQLEDHEFRSPVLAPGGLLLCVMFKDNNHSKDEIIGLDAQTLQLRHRFGLGLLNNAQHLCVVADELYVCDMGNHRLQVFSLTGEHRRFIMGEWRSPERLCCAEDRLCLVERDPREEDDNGSLAADTNPLQGCRILVMSLQGDILQVVTNPTEPKAVFKAVCYFGHTLLARYYRYFDSTDTIWRCRQNQGILAFRPCASMRLARSPI